MANLLPTAIQLEMLSDLRAFIGRAGNIWVKEGVGAPTTASKEPTNKIKNGGKKAKASPVESAFSGGAAKQVTITLNAGNTLDAGVDTFTIVVKKKDGTTLSTTVLTAVAGAPGANEFQIGGSAAATATNLATAIDGITGVSASAASAVVTVVGDATNPDFTVTSTADDPGEATIATSVAGKASLAIQIVKNSGQDPTDLTIAEIIMPFSLNGKDRLIRFGYRTQTGDTVNLMATGLKNVLTAGLDETDPVAQNGYIIGLGSEDTDTNLKDAMRLVFGSVAGTAFSVTTNTLTLLVQAPGVDGNNMWAKTQMRNSPPSPEITITSNVPQEAGFEHMAQFDKFGVNTNAELVEYQTGNVREKLAVPGAASAEGAFGVYFNLDPRVLEKINGSNALTYSDNSQLLLFGAAQLGNISNGKTVLFIFDDDDGEKGYVLLYNAFFTNLNLDLNIAAIDAIPVALRLQPVLDRADKFGYLRIVR